MNKTIYRQYDSRWGSKPYPTKSSSFAGNGCGCVACTHVIIERSKYAKTTPEPIRKYMVKQGFAYPNQGTTWAGIPATLKHYGFSVINHSTMSDLFKTLKARKDKGQVCAGVILFRGGTKGGVTWTTGGHYVAFTNYKAKNGKHYLYMKDSGARRHDGWYCYETTMKGLIPQVWSALPPVETEVEPAPTKDTTTIDVDSKDLIVDGKIKTNDVKAAQKLFGVAETGRINGQISSLKQYHKGFGKVINYGSGGASLIKAMQKYLQLNNPDGQLGPNTIRAIQHMIGVVADGIWGVDTSKAFQRWLNKNETLPKVKKKTKIKGMDISAWQGKVSKSDFLKAKADGIKFVILRLGYTGSENKKPTLDKVFENNYKNAIAAGLPVGVYYYSLAISATNAKSEAEFCIKNLKGKKITYPVYIDMEDPSRQAKQSKSTLANVCDVFCKTITKAGYTSGVYASLSWFNGKIGTITAPHTKWVAQYYKKCEYKGAYDMWQYSSSGRVDGLSGNIDMNYCYKKWGDK